MSKHRCSPTLLTYHLAQTNRSTVHIPKAKPLMSSPWFTLFLFIVLAGVVAWALNGSPLPFLS